jgi:RNA polymerase sigma-70 factor (ECF subfamily)
MTSSADSPARFAPTRRAEDVVETVSQKREPVPFGEVYETHFPFVWRMARRLGVPEVSLDDVVQEVFVFVHRHAATRRSTPFRGWLYGVVLNVARSYRPKKPPLEALERDDDEGGGAVDPSPLPDEALARTEALEQFHAILETLDAEKLEVFVLTELEQVPMARAAELLGINVNTAYARRRAARQMFEEAIARHHARDAWRLR